MKIFINKKEVETDAQYVAALAMEMQLPSGGVAVAVDGCIIPRGEWETKRLTEGCAVTVIKAAYGG